MHSLEAAKRKKFNEITIYEKGKCGSQNSGRNSGVIHAGIYYKPNTLRAHLCVKGANLLKDWCRKKNLLLLETGKLIVPTSEKEVKELERLNVNAKKNGAKTFLFSTKKEINGICDQINCFSDKAIWSPNTFNCNPKEVIISIKNECLNNGIKIIEDKEIKIKENHNGNYILYCEDHLYSHDLIINASGQHADIFARKCGNSRDESFMPVIGKYFECIESKSWNFPKTNIYPVPNPELPFLGLHISPYWDGKYFAGPTALPVFARESYDELKMPEKDVLITLMKFGVLNLVEKPKFLINYLQEKLRHISISEAAKDLKKMFPGFNSNNL